MSILDKYYFDSHFGEDNDDLCNYEDEFEVTDTEEDEEVAIPLEQMNEEQVQEYINYIGREPREEIDAWHINYSNSSNAANIINNADIIRYSYCDFSTCTISNHRIANFDFINGADFAYCTFAKCKISNVVFYGCNFDGAVFNHESKLKNVKFIDCSMNEITIEAAVNNVSVEVDENYAM